MTRPNVVIIMMDDLAWGDLACHGNPYVRTPVIDALHATSTRFTRYSSGPMCTPARASLMTGRYHHRTRAIDTFCGRSMIDPGEITLGHVLQRAGYRTGGYGKWHLGDAYPMRACDLGFDETLMHNAGGIGQPGDHPENHWREGEAYFDPVLHRNGRPERHTGYCTDIFTDAAIELATSGIEPFFCYLATNAPHTPLQIDDTWVEPYRELGVNEVHARLYGMVENIDWNVGRLLDAIPTDTIVVYTSDHGPCPSARGPKGEQRWNAGLRGEKGSLYQGAVKVPCFWRVPGMEGGDDDRVSSPIDVLPTIATLTGAALPDVALDGVDLFGDRVDRDLFLQWHRGDAPERYRSYAVLRDGWKLYRPDGSDADELYDLDADPGEERDVADAHAALVAALRTGYDAWFDDVSAAGFEPPRIVIGAPLADPVLLTRQDWHIEGGDGDMGEIAGWLGTTRGWWDVTVTSPGPYDVDVLLDPFSWSHPAFFTDITLSVNGKEHTTPWVLQVTRYSFRDLDLPSGPVRIEAWASRREARESALYVEVLQA